jgi:transcriptional regulator with XRE-family HTH domain
MTPFGKKLRYMRLERGISQKEMAESLGVSSAYLSALEHGRRGKPTWALLQRIIGYFNVIWDEAEELQLSAALSHPRVVIDTSGMNPKATLLANLLAEKIQNIDEKQLGMLIDQVKSILSK